MITRIIAIVTVIAVVALAVMVVFDTVHPFTTSEVTYLEKAQQWHKSLQLFYAGTSLQDYLSGNRGKVHVRRKAEGFQAVFDKWSADIIMTKPPERYRELHAKFLAIVDEYDNYLASIIQNLYLESSVSFIGKDYLPEARKTDWYRELEKLHLEYTHKLEQLEIDINTAVIQFNNETGITGVRRLGPG